MVLYWGLKKLKSGAYIFAAIALVPTSVFLASVFSYLRSPYYALAYAANDLVLIVLWGISLLTSMAYLPMVVCFLAFLANDTYGFFNWSAIRKKQV